MKKIVKIISILVIIIIIITLSISCTINSNNNYKNSIINRIKKHYKVDEIQYSNYYKDYYIITTKEEVIVLNKKYVEVYKEKLVNLKPYNKYEIIYNENKLVYEKKKITKNKVTYTYYDAKTGNKLNETSLEK